MLPLVLVEPAMEPGALHPAKECRGGQCSAAVAPPPVVVGGGRVDDNPCDGQVGVVVKRAGTEGVAKLVDGFVAP
jgi:hypothetical protein